MSSRSATPTRVPAIGTPQAFYPSNAPSEDREENPSTPTCFLDGYDDPSANIIIVGSDGIGLRIKDYHLKAASEFFCLMLEAGTKGGPVPLEATSLQLEFIMDRITGKTPRLETLQAIAKTAPRFAICDGWHALWSLTKLDQIAKKYMMTGVTEYIHRLINCYADQNPPAALLHACRCSPVDGDMAMAALRNFKDEMPIWMNTYFERREFQEDATPAFRFFYRPGAFNLRTDFAAALGFDAFFAYTHALEQGLTSRGNSLGNSIGHVTYNWATVADRFVKAMQIPQYTRSWLLQHDDDDGASNWSAGSSAIPSSLNTPRPGREELW